MKSNTLSWHSSHDIAKIRDALSENNIVAGSSDTVLGLLAPLTQEGFQALNQIKGRQEKPYVILVENFQSAQKLIENSLQIEKFSHCWPGPLTLVCTAKKGLPDYLASKNGTLAIRVPQHAGLLQLLEGLPGLFSTSANKAGQPVPTVLHDMHADILNQVAYTINDDSQLPLPSTIIDCTVDPAQVIREGAYSIARLKELKLLV